MSGYKKMIYFLVTIIILFAIILLVKIETTPKYDPVIYNGIYDEYEKIFGKENSIDENNLIDIQNIKENNSNKTTLEKTTSNYSEQGNVIGKIIIPKIDIRYPIIKETTAEYLKVAPTKYYGPNVNEVRKFSYSRT